MIDNWNDVVGQGDDVLVIGDWSLKMTPEILGIVKLLHGNVHLLPGNHDGCFVGNKKREKMIERYLEAGFARVIDSVSGRVSIEGRDVITCHFPYKEDHWADARYGEYRPRDEGNWLLCGHIHDRWKFKDKQINVGVDCWHFRPVSEHRIADHIAKWEKDNK